MKISLRLLVVAASLAVAAPAYAQGGGGGGGGMQMTPEQRLARQKEQMFKDITLAAPVSAQIDSIMMDGQKKQAEARSAGGDRAAMMESMQKMNTARNDAIKALLTDEQKKKFDENLAAMPQGRGRGGE